ncbi:hypothetical protein ACFQV8_13955 [Pseudonocardia benzenivorans]
MTEGRNRDRKPLPQRWQRNSNWYPSFVLMSEKLLVKGISSVISSRPSEL